MRGAPAVSVRCNGGPAWQAAQAALYGLAAAALCAWMLGHAGASPAPAWLAGFAVAALAWWRLPRRTLHLAWDGQAWQADGQAVRPEVMLDLGAWLLLRLRVTGGGTRWQALAAGEAGAAMHALRCALYAPAAAAGGAAPRAR